MKKVKLLFLLVAIMFCVTGCSKDDELTIQNKIDAEVGYVENGVEIFLKKCEKNEFLKDGVFDWERVGAENSIFLSAFSTIEDDLAYVKLDTTSIDNIKNTVQKIDNYVLNKDYDNSRIEYGNLYVLFENLSTSSLKRIRVLAMQIYISAISQNDGALNILANSIEEEYQKIELNEDNYIGLNRIKDVVYYFKTLVNEKKYDDLKVYSLRIIELL